MIARRLSIAALAATLVLALAALADAIPAVGSGRPDARLQDAWDRTYELSTYQGMPILVVYEDKDSTTLNQPLKTELSRLAKGDRYRTAVALIAVADVAGYDYWPVRGFVKSSIRNESRKQGTDIFCDWDGRLRAALGLVRGTSNVVLYGRDGKVLFAGAGRLTEARRDELLQILRRQVED